MSGYGFVRFEAMVSDGSTVVGTIQGWGGRLERDAMRRLAIAQRRAAEGRPTLLFEPEPGCVAMYPHETAQSQGESVVVPVVGTTFREVSR